MNYLSDVEQKIITRILKRALDKGYAVAVNDGEEDVLAPSRSLPEIQKEIGHTDQTYLSFFPSPSPYRERIGWVWLVHGNEEDVVSDCSDNPLTLELLV